MAPESTESMPIEVLLAQLILSARRRRKYTTLCQRVQALTLHAMGAEMSEIEAKTGIKERVFKAILYKAEVRGYVPGGPIDDEHVVTAPKREKQSAGTRPLPYRRLPYRW